MVLKLLRGIFSQEAIPTEDFSTSLFGLDPAERERIGSEEDLLRGFEAAMERYAEAERAEQNCDPEKSVAEGFVGSHPYERLASLYERRQNREAALWVSEPFV